jgi:predicted DCC family thiol-disulfide oxidoreductase YuxK
LWSLTPILYLLPRPLRDWLYNRIARNRYDWFGRRDVCYVPTPELRSRFLD